MEIKKAAHVDLERSKGLNLLLGLVVALAVLFTALEWRSFAEVNNAEQKLAINELENALIIDDLKEEEPEEPEPVAQPEQQIEAALPEEFKVVDNNQEVAKLSFVSAEETDKPLPPPPAPVAPAPVEEVADEIFDVVEENPEFPGGADELQKYLGSSIKYPDIAAENGIQGRVIVQFVVEKDGSTTAITIARGVDPSLDKEAVRVVKEMPRWKPGKQRGKPVRTKFTLPVVFRLQ